jgi:hypothetical protein
MPVHLALPIFKSDSAHVLPSYIEPSNAPIRPIPTHPLPAAGIQTTSTFLDLYGFPSITTPRQPFLDLVHCISPLSVARMGRQDGYQVLRGLAVVQEGNGIQPCRVSLLLDDPLLARC